MGIEMKNLIEAALRARTSAGAIASASPRAAVHTISKSL
jgi:hypothetical protein